MAALHPPLTLRAVADLDVEAPNHRAHDGQFFLILRRHRASPRPRRRSPDTPQVPTPRSARRPGPGADGTPAARRPRRPAGRDARRALGVGSSRRGPLAGIRLGARSPVASRGGRSAASGGRSHAAGVRCGVAGVRSRVAGPCCRPRPASALGADWGGDINEAAANNPQASSVERSRGRLRPRNPPSATGFFQYVNPGPSLESNNLSIDGTKVRANASKRKAMSYDRMQEEERRLASEVAALLRQADAVDEAEDARLGSAQN